MRIAVVIGHNESKKGALSKFFGLREYDFYSKVVPLLNNVTVFKHSSYISGYMTRIKNTAKKINKSKFDLVIELHFNSFFDSSANGCETLCYFKSIKGKKYASLFSNTVHNLTGIKLRNGGVKSLANKKDRGFASVYYTTAPTILIEPFFGSNTNDCKKIESPENMACIINEFIKTIS